MERFKKDIIKARIINMAISIFLIFILLIIRLYWIQIINWDFHSREALKQRSKEIAIYPDRGIIYDRNLIPLTNKKRETSLYIYKDDLRKKEIRDFLRDYGYLKEEDIKKKILDNNGILEVPFKGKDLKNLPKEVYLIDKTLRYDNKNFLSHVIGYVKKSENSGAYGIERVFDDILRTQEKNAVYFEFDGKKNLIPGGGCVVNTSKKTSFPSSVKLTVDYHIQSIIEDVIDNEGKNGAIIVSEVETGDIVAMVSRPNFHQDTIDSYLDRQNMDLYNKAIQVSYPPGSIFKIIVLLSALEEYPNIVSNNYYCKGYEEINNLTIKCNKQEGHGLLSINEALAYSCNSAFIQIAKEVGSDKIIKKAKELGFGEKIKIGLLEEVRGNLPSGEELLGPAIGNIALGQGNIEVTPLQITNLMMIIANDGIRKDLSIIDSIVSHSGNIVKKYNREKEKKVIAEENIKLIKSYLEDVVEYGTGRSMELKDIGGAAGKTGSAQGIINKKNTIHGWFSGYFPKNKPKYVITVFVEDDFRGSASAIPIFEKITKEINKIGR